MSLVQRSKRTLVSLLKKLASKHRLELAAYTARVKSVPWSAKAQDVAKAKFNALRNVCREVERKRGAASRT